MYYKISNMAKESVLEEEFGIPMQYANLYHPEPVIDGLNEETVFIITAESPAQIKPAIWGLLPEGYTEDWSIFQNLTNTLNLNGRDLDRGDVWYNQTFAKRRCLIPVTGFFTSYLFHGEVYPYFVKRRDGRPFALAGVYNRLEDGFLTCAILTREADNFTRKIQNIGIQMPLIVSKNHRDGWLNGQSHTLLDELGKLQHEGELTAHTIAKEFFDNGIVFDSMLEPMSYNGLPKSV